MLFANIHDIMNRVLKLRLAAGHKGKLLTEIENQKGVKDECTVIGQDKKDQQIAAQ